MSDLMVPDDSELIEQIGRGDHAAFRALLNRHAQYLYGVAHALAGNPQDAEDLVQETLIAALDGGFRGESSVRTWLVKILVNRAAMLRRARGRREKHTELAASEMMASSPSSAASVEAKLDFSTMLETLSLEHQQVIVLRELEQMSYEEIAAALGLPRGTIESRLHRAREELKKRFKDYF